MLKIRSVEYKWDAKAKPKIKKSTDNIVKSIASKTLSMANRSTPLSNRKGRGALRRSSKEYGVQGSNARYTIGSGGSNAPYAVYVWNFNDFTTNWTTNNTHSKWFVYTWKMHQQTIIRYAVRSNILK